MRKDIAQELKAHAPFTMFGSLTGIMAIVVYARLPIAVFLFPAVWVPCCTGDVKFPLLFARVQKRRGPYWIQESLTMPDPKGKSVL